MKRSGSAVVSQSYILIWMLPFLLHCNYNCGCFNTRLVIGIIHSYMLCTILILSYLCFRRPLSVPVCYQAVFSWSCWNNFCSCRLEWITGKHPSAASGTDLTWQPACPAKWDLCQGWLMLSSYAVTRNGIFGLYNYCGATVYRACPL